MQPGTIAAPCRRMNALRPPHEPFKLPGQWPFKTFRNALSGASGASARNGNILDILWNFCDLWRVRPNEVPDSSPIVPAHELFAGILERGWYKAPTNDTDETVEWPTPQMSEEEIEARTGFILSEVVFSEVIVPEFGESNLVIHPVPLER